MNIEAAFEVDFYGSDAVSVQLQSKATDERELVELLLFALFAIRQMVNLQGHEASTLLAHQLTLVAGRVWEFANHQSPNAPKSVPYRGPGQKRFVAKLRIKDDDFRFRMNFKGFGLTGRGIPYYAPNSVLAALRFLAILHVDDDAFIRRLGVVASNCGEALLSGRLSLTNQLQIAMAVVAMSEVKQVHDGEDEDSKDEADYESFGSGDDEDEEFDNYDEEEDEDLADDDNEEGEEYANTSNPRKIEREVNWFWPHSKTGTGGFCVLLTFAFFAGVVHGDPGGGIINVISWYVLVIIVRAVVLASMREGKR